MHTHRRGAPLLPLRAGLLLFFLPLPVLQLLILLLLLLVAHQELLLLELLLPLELLPLETAQDFGVLCLHALNLC